MCRASLPSPTSPDLRKPLTRWKGRALFTIFAAAVAAHYLPAQPPTPTHSPIAPPSNSYWHTEGNRIVDERGRTVRISGVNWSGFETKEAVPGGLQLQDYRTILQTIRRNGFNTVRLPFSNEMLESRTIPDHIRFWNDQGKINEDLRNLTSLEILDRIIAEAGRNDLKIILDNHRSEAGSSAEENGLWYTTSYPESRWIRDWRSLAQRYKSTSTVIGVDLRNEPHNALRGGACWDCGGSRDWHLAAQRGGNAILSVNPKLLIFVEGVDSDGDDTAWWGGNLEGVRRSPVRLALPGHLVYSPHVYGPAEYSQPWFNMETNSSTLRALWRRRWAYISDAGIAPVWIGEFGTPNTDVDVMSSQAGSEGQWFSALVSFLHSEPTVGWTYWGINGEDRYGLLDENYSRTPRNRFKLQALLSIGQPRVESEAAQSDAYDSTSHKSLDTNNAALVRGKAIRQKDRFVVPSTGVRQGNLQVPGAVELSMREAIRAAHLRAESNLGVLR